MSLSSTPFIFKSETICVKYFPRSGPACVVTFEPYSEIPTPERTAFAEELLAKAEISAVHVMSIGNHWYHTGHWREAVAAVASAVAPYSRIISYGSSMGGYGALRFAAYFGATQIIAISPQYHRDPRVVPFERRWMREAKAATWRDDLSHPLDPGIPVLLIFDPCERLDKKHVELIAAETPATLLPLPYSGHPSGTVLAECGLLPQLVRDAVNGVLQPDVSRKLARERRRASQSYLSTLAIAASSRHPQCAVKLAARATTIAPGLFYIWLPYARVLRQAGCHSRALSASERAFSLAPHNFYVVREYVRCLALAGRFAASLKTAVCAARRIHGGKGRVRDAIHLVLLGLSGYVRYATRISLGRRRAPNGS